MDHALVEHAQDDVDRDERSHDQKRRTGQRIEEAVSVALEAGGQRNIRRLVSVVSPPPLTEQAAMPLDG